MTYYMEKMPILGSEIKIQQQFTNPCIITCKP